MPRTMLGGAMGKVRARAPHRSTCGARKREQPWRQRSRGPQGGPSANPFLEAAARESSPSAAAEETPAPQVLIRGAEAAAGEESSVLAA